MSRIVTLHNCLDLPKIYGLENMKRNKSKVIVIEKAKNFILRVEKTFQQYNTKETRPECSLVIS